MRDVAERADVSFKTVGTVHGLHEMGLQSQVAQVSFDDIDLAKLLNPAISVVPQDPLELGRTAAEQLFRRIDGDRGDPIHTICSSALIARGSGEIPPFR